MIEDDELIGLADLDDNPAVKVGAMVCAVAGTPCNAALLLMDRWVDRSTGLIVPTPPRRQRNHTRALCFIGATKDSAALIRVDYRLARHAIVWSEPLVFDVDVSGPAVDLYVPALLCGFACQGMNPPYKVPYGAGTMTIYPAPLLGVDDISMN